MNDLTTNQTHEVSGFNELVATPFKGQVNALCWQRELIGNFAEIVNQLQNEENIRVISEEELSALKMSEEGQSARNIILNDLQLLKAHGASPVLNLIKYYERDEAFPFFPTDVYSFHVDRSPIPTDTFLCTYYGAASELLPNAEARQKVVIPEIRNELRKLYDGEDDGFESFLEEHFFDLHYESAPNARVINLGVGHLWRLAVDHPQSAVPPCVHRAPIERVGEPRLLLIC
ncbi:MAG: hypothetical protein IT236_15320 [Bacteroidia bacterium]|nr:hypothetical protein [Bacteroidia bacterium]